MEAAPKYPVKTVTKAIEIINYLAQDTGNRGVGVSELGRVLHMGKSTVHRLLDTLSYYGYVEEDPETNQYRLGWELYKIGQAVPQQNQLLNLNSGYILELSRKTQATVNLGILKRGEIFIISKIEGAYDKAHLSVQGGEYEAVHATGMGKIMISEMNDEEIWELFRGREELPPCTPNTITSVSQLLREVAKVRRDGYAVDAEEYCLGLYCIAMPVRDYTEKIVAAVSVSSPAGRMDEERKRIILEALGKCSRDISRSLGYRAAGEK